MNAAELLKSAASALNKAGVAKDSLIEVIEFDSPPFLQVASETPGVCRAIAEAWNEPAGGLPDPDQGVYHPREGRDIGRALRPLLNIDPVDGDELVFRNLTVGELHTMTHSKKKA